ncbi:MAG: insulinase family protein [Nitrospirales bacterium]|nr:insulinase family protein [Nitrospirales bacterium]
MFTIHARKTLVITMFLLGTLNVPAWAQVERVEELQFPPLPDIQILKPTRVVLENGLVVLLLEDHELPLINVSMHIRTGSRLESPDKVGLASLTGTVMRTGGSTTLSGDTLDDRLEGKAAMIETSIGETAGTASMSCLSDDFSQVIQMFADVLRQPTFDPEKLAIAKNQMLSSIARQNDSPDSIVSREYKKLIYGNDSPYARVPTYNTLGSITREDLIMWHRTYYHPNRMIMGLVGDFETSEALIRIKRVFGNWNRGPAIDDPSIPFHTTANPTVYYIEKQDMTQAKIIMGHLGLLRNHPDYYAIVVTNQILSGSFGARLFSNVRSQKGLAYDVHGGIGFGWDYPGLASLSMSTKTETTGQGIDALIEEARKMVTAPPTEQEVQKAKTSILNSFVFSVDSRSKIMGKFLTYEYYQYPTDWLVRFRKGIEAVTTQQVRSAAQQHLSPEKFAILVVGPREGTAPALARYQTVQELDISIPQPQTEN